MLQEQMIMRALIETTASQLVDDSGRLEISADAAAHPYRAWIWLSVFAAGGAFWFAVGLGIHALMQ
jgi:hypothetical protein